LLGVLAVCKQNFSFLASKLREKFAVNDVRTKSLGISAPRENFKNPFGAYFARVKVACMQNFGPSNFKTEGGI